MPALTSPEQQYYDRHLRLPEIGPEGQLKLKAARLLVIGAGGLGCPALLYLAAAGVGHLSILDPDTIELSNLQRQVLFHHQDVGLTKAEVAKSRLSALNPHITLTTYVTRFTEENAFELLMPYDLIIDATDNFRAKYLINDACYFLKKPLIMAAIQGFEGQLAFFTPASTNYRDLFPEPPNLIPPTCAEAGVLGVLAGILGCLQANEAIKFITGIGEPLTGKVLLFHALKNTFRLLEIHPQASNPLRGSPPKLSTLIPVEGGPGCAKMPSLFISAQELKQRLAARQNIQLIDVRDAHEQTLGSLGGLTIPFPQLLDSLAQIDPQRVTVLYCQSGIRSARAVALLADHFQETPCFSLQGGLSGWRFP